jgi:hypothetical protein
MSVPDRVGPLSARVDPSATQPLATYPVEAGADVVAAAVVLDAFVVEELDTVDTTRTGLLETLVAGEKLYNDNA